MRLLRLNHIELLRYAGLFTYACVGIPLLVEALSPVGDLTTTDHVGWVVSYVFFGISYWTLSSGLGRRRAGPARWILLLMMSASAVAISYFSHTGLAGILLLVIAGVLPWIMPVAYGIAWLLGEALAMVPVFVAHVEGYGWFDSLLQSGLYVGFSSFTFITSLVAKDQADSREDQRRLNAELRATRALLAESSRMGERLRISRELHDLLGHHLTALSLNLEVASHLVQDKAQEHVRQAQSLARLLLSDVREVVSQLRADDEIDLRKALDALIEGLPEPVVHIEMAPDFNVDDPRRAQVLLRCAQEVITNTIRHARARNLWLSFEAAGDGTLRVRARDDGQGAEAVAPGNGLSGMRERLAQFGGGLAIDTGRGRGFSLEAWMPREAT
ncbi:MAG TPA: sensor histidine kinase [Pseudomonadota bacterium]|nr:sensor histidine kinase [Xanthomonadales bacterium]HQW64604.1 sensor histidine kinase [Pseudomonadota bacterium]MBP6692308.1 sensor histidine kinase [Xanthomonadales bacterium]MBP7418995.1 sensor histidine kinase [Xanthomonadales bacterium]HQY36964.1 sensor histidine kinase [Pseudomonadota bacterium]